MSQAGLVIIGAGQAGFQLAASARAAGYDKSVTLIGGEPMAPYQRPPLSKAYLLGKQTRESLALQKASFFDQQDIALRTGSPVVEIDRSTNRVSMSNGESLSYDRLVIATGASNRRLAVPGADLDGVVTLRNLGEADAIKERIAEASQVVVIGGGFVGLEFAAVATQLGKAVTVVEAQSRLMQRAVLAPTSNFYVAEHARRGVRVLLAASVRRFEGQAGRVRAVCLGSDEVMPCDLALVGIGAIPNDQLAAASGLPTANGVWVDRELRSADANIFAIGDCAAFVGLDGRRRRLESVQNAIDQARHVARALTGPCGAYETLPWFWSDQYDCKLQIAGLTADADETIVRGDLDQRRFSVIAFHEDRMIGADSINQPAEHAVLRRLLGAGALLSPEKARDLSLDLRALARAVTLREPHASHCH